MGCDSRTCVLSLPYIPTLYLTETLLENWTADKPLWWITGPTTVSPCPYCHPVNKLKYLTLSDPPPTHPYMCAWVCEWVCGYRKWSIVPLQYLKHLFTRYFSQYTVPNCLIWDAKRFYITSLNIHRGCMANECWHAHIPSLFHMLIGYFSSSHSFSSLADCLSFVVFLHPSILPISLFLQVTPCACLIVSLLVQSVSAVDHSVPGASRRWEHVENSMFVSNQERRRENKADISQMTHQSFNATHTCEYNVHVWA